MDPAPLELESRRRLYEAIHETPGLHLRELARQSGLDVRTVLWHLDQLGKHGLVTLVEDGAYRRAYPRTANGRRAEVVDARDKPVVSLLRGRVPLYVALVLLTRDAATHQELVQDAGVSRSTLSYHLGKMQRAGLLRKEGNRYRLREPDRVARLLYAHRPAPSLLDEFVSLWEDFTL